jgi:hypothetical protein
MSRRDERGRFRTSNLERHCPAYRVRHTRLPRSFRPEWPPRPLPHVPDHWPPTTAPGPSQCRPFLGPPVMVIPHGFSQLKFACLLLSVSPLALGNLVLADPKASGQSYFDLRLVGTSVRSIGQAAHPEPARRTPAKLDAADFTLVPTS